MDWLSAYSRLFNILDKQGTPAYHSGSEFIKVIQQVDPGMPKYNLYIEERTRNKKSTSRSDYYWDIINQLDEQQRLVVFRKFIEILKPYYPNEVQELSDYIFSNGNSVPVVKIPRDQWSSERLNTMLSKIDDAINLSNYNNAMTLVYTCLEGLYKSYVHKHIPAKINMTDLIPLSKLVREDIESKLSNLGNYPSLMVQSVSTITHAIANSRNSFSDSHFDNDAKKWLATYSRDLVNSIGRLILHFL
ncbi:hypothetical protein [Providencia rettgeri]|uniref:hypothetical protein n=1 Tax=Providencia rettgeri TaxID=587 RepID=UPI0023AB0C4C|nr:hypothetical protein [Providencia rettgeri]